MIRVYRAIRKNDKVFLSLHTAVCNIIHIYIYMRIKIQNPVWTGFCIFA